MNGFRRDSNSWSGCWLWSLCVPENGSFALHRYSLKYRLQIEIILQIIWSVNADEALLTPFALREIWIAYDCMLWSIYVPRYIRICLKILKCNRNTVQVAQDSWHTMLSIWSDIQRDIFWIINRYKTCICITLFRKKNLNMTCWVGV
jgi:hypothetical protein